MRAVGHYEQDPCFEDARAENVCRICRVSWEYEFFKNINDELKYRKRISPRRLRKDIGYMRIQSAWFNDVYRLKNSEDFRESPYFAVFNSHLPQSKIDDIDYFIRKL